MKQGFHRPCWHFGLVIPKTLMTLCNMLLVFLHQRLYLPDLQGQDFFSSSNVLMCHTLVFKWGVTIFTELCEAWMMLIIQ